MITVSTRTPKPISTYSACFSRKLRLYGATGPRVAEYTMSAPRPDTAATQPMSTTSRCRHAAVGLRRSVLAALRGTERGIEETATSRAPSVGGPAGVVDVAGDRLGGRSRRGHDGRL